MLVQLEALEAAQPVQSTPRARSRLVMKALTVLVALVSIFTLAAAQPASANTPSDYSSTFYVGATPGFQGLPVTVGWTQDHAWVISSYGAALSAGSGFIASQLCSLVSGETGPFNPVGRACSTLASSIIASLVSGQPGLTDHGLWMAYYVWGGQTTTSGTW